MFTRHNVLQWRACRLEMPLEVRCVSVRENFRCCCCNCRVKTGTIMIGWLQLDLSLFELLHCIASLVDIKKLFPDDARAPVIVILLVIGVCLCVNGLLVFSARRAIPVLALPYLLLGLIALAVMCLFIFKGVTHLVLPPRGIANLFGDMVLGLLVTTQLAVRILIEILLLYGAYREEQMFLLPYVVMDPIGVVWVATAVLLFTIYRAGENLVPYLLVIPIIDSLFMGIRAYMWVIVYSYYRQLVRGVCPGTEIPMQDVATTREIPEIEPIVTTEEQEQPKKENATPVTESAVLRIDKKFLWPSSREYLL
ncbi:uncharacterized protein [Periplaneta americana]|uniref:uncharacterized protein n=1 Tax=Periplaneta americana TaxID=6978 RepID=UPI0037E71218